MEAFRRSQGNMRGMLSHAVYGTQRESRLHSTDRSPPHGIFSIDGQTRISVTFQPTEVIIAHKAVTASEAKRSAAIWISSILWITALSGAARRCAAEKVELFLLRIAAEGGGGLAMTDTKNIQYPIHI